MGCEGGGEEEEKREEGEGREFHFGRAKLGAEGSALREGGEGG